MKTALMALLLGAVTATAATAVHAGDQPTDSRPSSDAKAPGTGIKHDAHVIGEAVKTDAKKVGVAAKDAAHKVADEAVKGAHAVSAGAKAGYAKAKETMQGGNADSSK